MGEDSPSIVFSKGEDSKANFVINTEPDPWSRSPAQSVWSVRITKADFKKEYSWKARLGLRICSAIWPLNTMLRLYIIDNKE